MSNVNKVEMVSGEETDEWPEEVKATFIELVKAGDERDFSVICTVGLNCDQRRLSAFFSPRSSSNPHLAEMCEDIGDMFLKMAKRLRQ